MTQPPFSGNDFFDQIDSVARNLTGNAFRLKKNDPTAPQKFTEFVAQSEQEFGAPSPLGIQAQPQAAQPQSFTDFEQAGFQQPTELDMVNAAAEARIADPREQQPTFIDPTMDPDALRNVFFGLNPIGGSIVNLLTPRADGQNRVFTPQVPEGFFGSEENLGKLAPFANAAREITSPFDVLTTVALAGGGPAAAAALRGTNKAGRIAANLVDPVVRGGLPQRLAAETGVNLGATVGALEAPKLLPEDAPAWQKIAAGLAGGLLAGGGSLAALNAPRIGSAALRQAGQAGEQAAAAVGRTGVPNVLDPVPPQTVAGRAASGAGDVSRGVSDAVTGQPFEGVQFRGFGRETVEEAFSSKAGAQENIFGDAVYSTPSEGFAKEFGPNVEQVTTRLENPLVISTDTEYAALAREAGLRSSAPATSEEVNALRAVITGRGHDGVIIRVPESELTGKRLQQVFGDDTVVDFAGVRPDVTAARGIPEDAAAAARGVGDAAPLRLVDEPYYLGVDIDPVVVTPRVGSDTRFLEVAEAQRGRAERLGTSGMSAAGGSGVRQYLTEAIGDVINRMADDMPDSYSSTAEKVRRGTREMSQPRFRQELEDELRSNYDFRVSRDEFTGTYDEFKNRALDMQEAYAEAHAALPVVNQAHRDAQAAAVAFGEQRYADSLAALRRIESHLGSQEAFDAYRLEGAQPVTQAPTTPATSTTAAARGAGVDLDEKLAWDSALENPRSESPQAELSIIQGSSENLPRYYWHMPPSKVPVSASARKILKDNSRPEDGGLNAYILKEQEAKAILGDVNIKGIWLSKTKDYGESSVLVDISKLDNNSMYSEASGIVHRGDIPKSAIVETPTTPATGTAAARQVTPQQQAIIDDVGTGALPADDLLVTELAKTEAAVRAGVGVDELGAVPVARAADDAVRQVTPSGDGFQLPRELARSRVNFGRRSLEFADDFDRALYIATSKNPSKRRKQFEDIVRAELDNRGLPSGDLTAAAAPLRERVRRIARSQTGNKVTVPPSTGATPVSARIPATGPRVRYVDAQGNSQQGVASFPDSTPDMPSDLAGAIPPNRVIIEPPSTGGVSGSLFEPVQKFQTQMDVTFNPNVSRMVGEQLRKTGAGRVFTGFDPSLAAKNPGQRSVIVYANLLDEASNKSLRVTSHFDELGTREEIFGSPIDSMGVFTEGPFAGRALNEVASLPVLRSKATPAQAEYLNRLTRVDKEASEFMRVHGSRDVGFVDETKEFFSARRIWAKVDPQTGEVIKTQPAPNRHAGLGTKTSSEKARVVAEIEDLVKDGFVLMPYDETVRLKVKTAMRSNVENEWVEWAKTNYKMEERPPGKQDYVKAQERLFQKYVGGDAEARDMIRDAEKGLEVFLRQAPTGFVADTSKLVSNIGMSLSLAGDASIFLIHYLRLLGWDALPVTAATGLKMPFGTTARSSTAFAKQFSRALMSPKKSSAFSQHVISQNREVLKDARTLILFASEELPELGEGFKGLRRVDDFLGGLPRFKRYAAFPARVPVRIIVAANEALSAAMNAAGIYLFKAMKPLAKNADGTINPQKLQDVEDFINNIRGVSSSARLGSSPSRRYNEGLGLLAPRLRRASGALSSQIIEGGLRGTLARDALAGLFTGTTLAFAGLVIGRGIADGKSDAQIRHELEETLIPGGSTYMLSEVYGQMVGPGGKEIQDLRMLAKIVKSPESFLDGNLQTNPLIRWARGQGSIPLSVATDFIAGRDVVGRVTRPGQPVGGGKSTPFKEGMIGLAKNMGSRAIFLWLQSAVMEPGTLRGRAVRGVADFFGMRAFEEGKFGNLQNAAWEKHNKSLDELNQLERYRLEKDPEWGDQLLLLDEGRADDGDKFAGYRVERADLEQLAFDRSSDFLGEMITALSKGGSRGMKGENGERDKPGAWSVLNTFADNIGEVKGTLSTQLDQYRFDNELTGYSGEEPKNDFDRMLNEWYELLDVHTEKVTSPRGREVQHKLNFDTWIPASEAFVKALKPELQEQLQQWRDRKQSPKGIEAILEARQPNDKYGVDKQGNPELPDSKQLYNAVTNILVSELGMTDNQFNALRSDN